jgi:hypothetical protein
MGFRGLSVRKCVLYTNQLFTDSAAIHDIITVYAAATATATIG